MATTSAVASADGLRNCVLFVAGVLILSGFGGLLLARGAEVGAVLFVSGPLLMAVLLRTFGGDGWRDSGLCLGRPAWYVFALLINPMTFGLILAVGGVTGSIEIKSGTAAAVLSAMTTELVPRMLFSFCEEMGWRGYLEPRLEKLGVADYKRHTVVGVIWAAWHVPYIMNNPGYSELPLIWFGPLFVAGVVAMAFVFGQLRKISDSVWPVVLAHGVGNILAFPLLYGGSIVFRHPGLLATRPESIVFIVLWAAVGRTILMISTSRKGQGRRSDPVKSG
jgi:membrane protease YdiL (CAAX protease family)